MKDTDLIKRNYRAECCNKDCGWFGKIYECLFTRDEDGPLCPECNGSVEEQT